MTWQGIVEAWATELRDQVEGLTDARIHLYAPWSLENLHADANERHLAVWPDGDAPETAAGFVSTPSSLLTQLFVVGVWEGVQDAARLMDDDEANSGWLTLHEAIRARFLTKANIRLGDDQIMITRYVGSSFPAHSSLRVMEFRFSCEIPVQHT